MNLVETMTVAIATGRRIGGVPLILRLVVGLGVLVAVLGTVLPAWEVPDAYVVLAVIFAVVWVFAPDTHAGLVFLAFLGMAWLTAAPGELGPGVVVTALGLLVAHVAAALAAAMPVTAGADRRLVLRWAGPTAWITAAVLAASAVAAALEAWSPPGSIVVTLVALGVVTAAAWWWSVPPVHTGGDDIPAPAPDP